jgi:hypothetical protein
MKEYSKGLISQEEKFAESVVVASKETNRTNWN